MFKKKMPRKQPGKQTNWIVAEAGSRMYRLKEIEEYGLAIPPLFQHCMRCKGPAVYLHCFRANHEDANWLPEDLETREFIEQMRHWAGSNFEIPLCEEHGNAGEAAN
jgi:hypothetical protein